MYYSSSKLASVLLRKNSEEALKYLQVALESAEFLNDIFYIASASLAIGDFYYDKKQDEIEMMSQLMTTADAKKLAQTHGFDDKQIAKMF